MCIVGRSSSFVAVLCCTVIAGLAVIEIENVAGLSLDKLSSIDDGSEIAVEQTTVVVTESKEDDLIDRVDGVDLVINSSEDYFDVASNTISNIEADDRESESLQREEQAATAGTPIELVADEDLAIMTTFSTEDSINVEDVHTERTSTFTPITSLAAITEKEVELTMQIDNDTGDDATTTTIATADNEAITNRTEIMPPSTTKLQPSTTAATTTTTAIVLLLPTQNATQTKADTMAIKDVVQPVQSAIQHKSPIDIPIKLTNATIQAAGVFSSQRRRYDGAQVWRILVQNDKDKKLADELQKKFDGQVWKEVKAEVDYLLKPNVLDQAERHIRSANLSRIILIHNLQNVIEVENPPMDEIENLENRKGHRLTWKAYHRLADIHSFFDYMANTYPDICSVETIGYSVQKRPLKILKVSNGKKGNPAIWIDGGIHAREWISPATVTYVANNIVEGWDDLPAYMRNIDWYIHGVANPDGYEYTHTTDRLWRKNLRSHGRQCPGVDLNRNFGYQWGGKGTSASPCAQIYRGAKAFSEPETMAIASFLTKFGKDYFKAYLSFHSYGQYILYPWGYDSQLPSDSADLDRVAREAGTKIARSGSVKYTVGAAAKTLYPAAGGSDDWAKGILGIKYSFTIEMGDTGRYGFVLPATMIDRNGKDGYTFVETVASAVTKGRKNASDN